MGNRKMIKEIIADSDKWSLSLILFVALAMTGLGMASSAEIGSGISHETTDAPDAGSGFNTLENPEAGPILFAVDFVVLETDASPDGGVEQ